MYRPSQGAIDAFKQGWKWQWRDEFTRAIPHYDEALRIDPKFYFAWVQRAGCFDSLRNFGEAVADYSDAIDLVPKYSETYTMRAGVKIDSGDKGGARSDFERSRSLSPSRFIRLGEAEEEAGDDTAALQSYTRGIKYLEIAINLCGYWHELVGPNHHGHDVYYPQYNLYIERARLYERLGDLTAALRDYERFVEVFPYMTWYEGDAEDKIERFRKTLSKGCYVPRRIRHRRRFMRRNAPFR